jgi:hypothetical protein
MSTIWTSAVTVAWAPRNEETGVEGVVISGGWWAKLNWTDWPGNAPPSLPSMPGCMDGSIRTRYPAALRTAIDNLMVMAERLGVELRNVALFADGNGDDPGITLPAGWREKIRAEAKRRGWDSYKEAGA